MTKDSIFEKLDHNFLVVRFSGDRFYPFGHVFHRDKNVQKPLGLRKWAHKVNTPHIKKLND